MQIQLMIQNSAVHFHTHSCIKKELHIIGGFIQSTFCRHNDEGASECWNWDVFRHFDVFWGVYSSLPQSCVYMAENPDTSTQEPRDFQKWTCHGKLPAWSWVQTALFGWREALEPIWINRCGLRKGLFSEAGLKVCGVSTPELRAAPEVVSAVQGEEPAQMVRYQRQQTFSHAFKWERSLS